MLWVPSFTTSTDQSRTVLGDTVAFADAVFNVGRTALLVAALVTGDVDVLRTATEDRLHQDARFARSLPSHGALTAALEAGAWCGWLSGSGPSVAALCDPADAERIAAAYPEGAAVKILAVDQPGAIVVERADGLTRLVPAERSQRLGAARSVAVDSDASSAWRQGQLGAGLVEDVEAFGHGGQRLGRGWRPRHVLGRAVPPR